MRPSSSLSDRLLGPLAAIQDLKFGIYEWPVLLLDLIDIHPARLTGGFLFKALLVHLEQLKTLLMLSEPWQRHSKGDHQGNKSDQIEESLIDLNWQRHPERQVEYQNSAPENALEEP